MAQDTITINPTAVNNDVFLTGDSAAVPSAPVSSAVSASAAPEQGEKTTQHLRRNPQYSHAGSGGRHPF